MASHEAVTALQEQSRRLLALVEDADAETLAGALGAMLDERERHVQALAEAVAAGLAVPPSTADAIRETDQRIARALSRRRDEARLALASLNRRPSVPTTAPPPPRFLDRTG